MPCSELKSNREDIPIITPPKRQLWKLYSKVKSLRDVEEIFKVLDEVGLKMVHAELVEDLESYNTYVVVDASEVRESCRDVSLKLCKKKGIQEVVITESEAQGIEVLRFIGRRTSDAILMRTKCFAMILNVLKDLWGSAGKFISYSIGVEVGREHYQWLQKLVGEKLEGRACLEAALCTGAELGWWERASLEAFNNSQGVLAVKLYGCVECKYAEKTGPNADFFRGFFGGLASELMGGEFEAEESSCIVKGDLYCLIRAWRR